jgi:hypothetical protein
MVSARMILLILAFMLFAIAALGVKHPKLDLISAGLALWVLSLLLV